MDTATDCRDFFELSAGGKTVPQDKTQRLYILAFNEARVTGRVLADGLTKPMTSRVLMQTLSAGYVEFGNEGDHHCLLRRLPTLEELKEDDLYKDDLTLRQEVQNNKRAFLAMTLGFSIPSALKVFAAFSLVTMATAHETERTEDSSGWGFFAMILGTFTLRRMIEECCKWLMTEKKVKVKEKAEKTEKALTPTSTPESSPNVSRRELNLDGPSSSSSTVVIHARIPEHIWGTEAGTHFHIDPQCRSLKACKFGVTKKTLCGHCADKALSKSRV